MRILSGIKPSGEIHIGNYLGAIKQWIDFQRENDCLFSIVDLHGLTQPYDRKNYQKIIKDVAAIYLAAGLNPKKSLIFIQSRIPEHTELMWLLNTITPIGDLLRMTQYKEQKEKFKKVLNAGLLNYPILMAADILLYKSELVPVGEDQLQHLELARTLAKKFNAKFGKIFPEPKGITQKIGARIMSLQNPAKKMSKSDSFSDYISLSDSPEAIREKIKIAVTDSGKEIIYNKKEKPAISNLLTIYSLFSDEPIKNLEKKYQSKGYAEFKKDLAEIIIVYLTPFQKKIADFQKNPALIKKILSNGEKKAKIIAQKTMKEVKEKMGLL